MFQRRVKHPILVGSGLALLLGVLLAVGAGLPVPTAQAQATFTVTKTADTNDGTCDADCSLREAITAAYTLAGTDTIAFNIPTSDPGYKTNTPLWWRIQPTSALPTITDPVIIDGYTQPGASPNTNGPGLGLNTVLKIELDGSSAGVGANGLYITAGNSTVRGLVINRFDSMGVRLVSNGGNVVEGNFIGTDVTGTVDLGNTVDGVKIFGPASNNIIGGTTAGARNIISGNNNVGVFINFTTWNTVQGNFIGTDVTGAMGLANSFVGVWIEGSIAHPANNNTIGGNASGAGNIIAFNGFGGVALPIQFSTQAGTGNAILGNAIFSNTILGIDLGDPFGVTANDFGDADTGPNNLQNFPVLTSALSGSTIIEGSLNSIASTTFRLEFFANSACDPLGYGEGETFLGFTDVTTDGTGNVSFTATFATTVAVGQLITATATDPNNNTSEFSACQAVAAAPVPTPTPIPGVSGPGLGIMAGLAYPTLRRRGLLSL